MQTRFSRLPTTASLSQPGIKWNNTFILFVRYETAVEHAEALQLPYDALAELLHCNPEEIAIVQSATTAWQQVLTLIPVACSSS